MYSAPTRYCISRYKFPLFLAVLVLASFFCNTANALGPCPTASSQQITQPCKFSPGIHRYFTLTITSDVYLETNSTSCEHSFQVNQGFIIQNSATIYVGFCEKHSGLGNGVAGTYGGSGASYGGRGGTAKFQVFSASEAIAYGSVISVSTHGSRGGGVGGGKGGGYLNIVAKKLIFDGIIRANGENAQNNGGGGSGGGIAISCDEISGTGRIEAFGGLGSGQGGGGAGGRISVISRRGTFRGLTHTFGGKISKLYSFFSVSETGLNSAVRSKFYKSKVNIFPLSTFMYCKLLKR